MYYTIAAGLTIPTLVLSLILVGWQSLVFWIICVITVMQIILFYLLPQYWVGWKMLVKQGLLIALGLAGMCATVLLAPDALVLLLPIFVQTIPIVLFA